MFVVAGELVGEVCVEDVVIRISGVMVRLLVVGGSRRMI